MLSSQLQVYVLLSSHFVAGYRHIVSVHVVLRKLHVLYLIPYEKLTFPFFVKKTLKESLNAPEFVMTDFAKFGRPEQCNMAMIALHAYKKKHGSLPKPWCKVCSHSIPT